MLKFGSTGHSFLPQKLPGGAVAGLDCASAVLMPVLGTQSAVERAAITAMT